MPSTIVQVGLNSPSQQANRQQQTPVKPAIRERDSEATTSAELAALGADAAQLSSRVSTAKRDQSREQAAISRRAFQDEARTISSETSNADLAEGAANDLLGLIDGIRDVGDRLSQGGLSNTQRSALQDELGGLVDEFNQRVLGESSYSSSQISSIQSQVTSLSGQVSAAQGSQSGYEASASYATSALDELAIAIEGLGQVPGEGLTEDPGVTIYDVGLGNFEGYGFSVEQLQYLYGEAGSEITSNTTLAATQEQTVNRLQVSLNEAQSTLTRAQAGSTTEQSSQSAQISDELSGISRLNPDDLSFDTAAERQTAEEALSIAEAQVREVRSTAQGTRASNETRFNELKIAAQANNAADAASSEQPVDDEVQADRLAQQIAQAVSSDASGDPTRILREELDNEKLSSLLAN